MRTYYDTNGIDVTTTVTAAMTSARTLIIRDLYWFQYVNAAVNTATVTNAFFTDSSTPVGVVELQSAPGILSTVNATYIPTRISRQAFQYKIGLEAQTCDVTLYPNDSVTWTSAPWGWKWAAVQGYLDECPVWIHRAVFDVNDTFLGTTLMFRGFVREVKADRAQVTLTLSSLLDFFQNVQLPTQLIGTQNRLPPFFPAGNPTTIGGFLGSPTLMTSTPTDIMFDTHLPVGWTPPPDHSVRDSFLIAYNQTPPLQYVTPSNRPSPVMFRIRDNIFDSVNHILHLYPYEPINPVTPLFWPYVTIYSPQNQGNSGPSGFPYVPVPETTLGVS